MYNSGLSINKYGFLVASTEYRGLVAFYLKRNNSVIEKKWYEINSTYTFKEKLDSGIFSAIFFFKDNEGKVCKYETDEYAYNSETMLLFNINVEGVTLREEKDYKITYFDRRSNITFITFNGTKTTKETAPFGLSYVMLNGWNLISVAQDNDSQYQGLSLKDFYEVVQPIIVNKEVYTYGVSLGGYCALYFGGCINATIIAASPKNSAHPSINMARFRNASFNHEEFSAVPITNKSVYIVYDPTIKSDSMFIANCISLAYPSPNFLMIENGTHAILQTMLKAKVLKLYINTIVNKNYNNSISRYIRAKCLFFQEKDKDAFKILEDIVKENLCI